jgi:uncharacterized membrane protein
VTNRSQDSRQYVLLLVGLIAILLRIILALQPGLWADEIFSLAIATGHSLEHPAADANPLLGDFVEPRQAQPPEAFHRYLQHETPSAGIRRVIRAVLLSDTSPPLYYLLLNLWTRVLGASDAALRLFSCLWALACFPLIWALGREIGGRRITWTACILFAFAPRALYYASEGRMYSLVWFLGLSLAWFTLALERRGPRPHLFLLWGLSGAAGMLTHYFFAFIWLASFTWLWLHPGKVRRRHILASAAVMGLLVLPWYLQLPDNFGRWRVTGDWLAYPLSWRQTFTAPLLLAGSLVLGRGVWGGSMWADSFAAMLYTFLALVILKRGLWRLFSPRRLLLWLWLLMAVLGPILFDWLMHTNASTVVRYALPGLPAAILLAGIGICQLPRRIRSVFLLLIIFAWLPAIREMFVGPSRPWEPFPEVAARLRDWAKPSDLIIVHSIPSGVLGTARYSHTNIPLVSWVVQLGQRRVPDDMDMLLATRCRVALVKIHDLGKASPAETWLRAHAIFDRQDRPHPFTSIVYFLLRSPHNSSTTRCPAP